MIELLEQLLTESRRIYKRLPNINSYKELEPYKDKDDYYISFTDLEKIGINPKSEFRTPMGIYMYPLKEAWNKYKVEEKGSIKQAVPFAGDRPNVYLVKLKDNVKFVKKASDYTTKHLENDLVTLKKHALENKEKFYKSFDVNSPEELTDKIITSKFRSWAGSASKDEHISRLWNVTRNMALKGRDIGIGKNSDRVSVITNWNTLLYRVLGYYGFADKEGLGYIHDYEPVQAVFFTKLAFTVVKLIPNKEGNKDDLSSFYKKLKDNIVKIGKTTIDFGSQWDNKTNIKEDVWIYKAIKENKVKTDKADIRYDMISKSIYWSNGIWKDGTWEGGHWQEGIWNFGTWNKGYWGTGIWRGGIWHDGTWKNGTWKNGIWNDGNWSKGFWNDGTWKGGVWQDGTWHSGIWKEGRWMNGVWKSGIWENGTWVDGTWEGGTWKGGKIWDEDKKGNYDPSWKWFGDILVESPISPAEYWKDKNKG